IPCGNNAPNQTNHMRSQLHLPASPFDNTPRWADDPESQTMLSLTNDEGMYTKYKEGLSVYLEEGHTLLTGLMLKALAEMCRQEGRQLVMDPSWVDKWDPLGGDESESDECIYVPDDEEISFTEHYNENEHDKDPTDIGTCASPYSWNGKR